MPFVSVLITCYCLDLTSFYERDARQRGVWRGLSLSARNVFAWRFSLVGRICRWLIRHRRRRVSCPKPLRSDAHSGSIERSTQERARLLSVIIVEPAFVHSDWTARFGLAPLRAVVWTHRGEAPSSDRGALRCSGAAVTRRSPGMCSIQCALRTAPRALAIVLRQHRVRRQRPPQIHSQLVAGTGFGLFSLYGYSWVQYLYYCHQEITFRSFPYRLA